MRNSSTGCISVLTSMSPPLPPPRLSRLLVAASSIEVKAQPAKELRDLSWRLLRDCGVIVCKHSGRREVYEKDQSEDMKPCCTVIELYCAALLCARVRNAAIEIPQILHGP